MPSFLILVVDLIISFFFSVLLLSEYSNGADDNHVIDQARSHLLTERRIKMNEENDDNQMKKTMIMK